MDGSALHGNGRAPGWGDVRAAVMDAARACADPAAVAVLRDLAGLLRPLAFDEAVIEAEASRRAGEIIAAAGLVPPPRARHLRAVG